MTNTIDPHDRLYTGYINSCVYDMSTSELYDLEQDIYDQLDLGYDEDRDSSLITLLNEITILLYS